MHPIQPAHVVRRAALALGSNLGDRLATLQAGLDALAATPEVSLWAVSSVFETDPVGGPDQPDYLNAVVVVDTARSPRELLLLAQQVEAGLGRVRGERFGPRTLDVDVLAVGDLVVDETGMEPPLTVPHPRAAGRAFVLVPWAGADPEAVLPGRGPVRDLLAQVDRTGVRARPDLVLDWRR